MDGSPLNTLPSELRLRIYELVCLETRSILLFDDTKGGVYPRRDAWHPPPLLQVCRQMRNEASSVFYGRNTFACLSLSVLHKVLARLDVKDVKEIRSLRVEFPRQTSARGQRIVRRARKVFRNLGTSVDQARIAVKGYKDGLDDGEVVVEPVEVRK